MYLFKRFVPEDDASELYSFIFEKNLLISMPGQPIIHNKNEFTEWIMRQLNGFYHDLYLIYYEQQLKGYLLSFDYRVYDRHCQIYGFWEVSIKCNLLRQFVRLLCSEYPLRKIIIQSIEENLFVQSAREIGFFEEACLKEYKYIDGHYVDMHVLSYLIRSNIDGR